jgi:DNA-binding LacI/PurR family transcriptional regulator
VLCSNDHTALLVRHRLHRLGLRAPEDVRLAGYDGEPLALATGLTTAAFDHAALARTALAALLDDGPLGDVPATLRIGETA